MPRPEHFTAGEVRSGVREVLGTRAVSRPQRTGRGFGNENWRVRVDGRDLLVKITPPDGHPVDKLAAAAEASQLARRAGVPVPDQVLFSPRCEAFGGAVTRIQEYLPGHHPDRVLSSAEAASRFFGSLGDAVARLHTVTCEGFASRLSGGQRFATWHEYVAHRVPQVVARARAVNAYEEDALQAATESLLTAAAAVSPGVRPRLCHRDLWLDNVLVDEHGEVVALLDFDLAEPWDRAVDEVKLTWQVFPRFRGAAARYHERYFSGAARPPQWAQRVWVAAVLELLNTVPNAVRAGDADHEHSARRALAEVLRSGP